HLRNAGRQQAVDALHFNEAEAAGAHVGEAVDVAQRRNEDVVLLRDFENGLVGASTAVAAVDLERGDLILRRLHAPTSAGLALGLACLISQTPAGHRCSSMCAAYSSRKYFSVVTTGLGALWPSPQRLVFRTVSQSRSSSARSSAVPVPLVMRFSISCMCTVPTRQGMHLPHDSVQQKSRKYLATSGMHDVSSITIRPPEPMIDPTLPRCS